jgi:TPR repeat protein
MTAKEIKTLEQSAQKGDKKAAAQLNELGVDYQFGNNGKKVDLAQALHYYMIAAEGGNTNAMCNAAYCYATGVAGKVDAEKAFGLYQKAAGAGDLNGMTNLAGCFLNGFGAKQDAVEAIKWLAEALNAGAKNLQETLEQVFASLSSEDIKKFKQSGYNAAQYQMAEYCLKSRKSKDAILWYVQSYKSGNADAVTRMMALAEDFRHGKNGQKENLPFAYQLYVNAAECGDVEARTKVAYCLYNGIGIEKDTKRAFALYEQLANEGNEKGMANIGLIYCKGEGVQKDIQKAIYWSTRAAEELGSVNAMNTLTHIYGEEEGFINHEQAAKWFFELIKRDCEAERLQTGGMMVPDGKGGMMVPHISVSTGGMMAPPPPPGMSRVYENTRYNKDLYEKIKNAILNSKTEEEMMSSLSGNSSGGSLLGGALSFTTSNAKSYINQAEEAILRADLIRQIEKDYCKDEDSPFKELFGAFVIPEGTKRIGKKAFFDCPGLTSVTIPDSVTSIGECAFQGCSSLKKIIVPKGTKQRFAQMEGLKGLEDKIVEE